VERAEFSPRLARGRPGKTERWNLLMQIRQDVPRKSYVAQWPWKGASGPGDCLDGLGAWPYGRASASLHIDFRITRPRHGWPSGRQRQNRPRACAISFLRGVDRRWITVKALKALAEQKVVPAERGRAGDQDLRHQNRKRIAPWKT